MRTKAERIHNTWKKIFQRRNLLKAKDRYSIDDNSTEFIDQPHRLAKDKLEKRNSNLHTNNKTKRHIHGNYQKTKNYNTHDQRQIDAMDCE